MTSWDLIIELGKPSVRQRSEVLANVQFTFSMQGHPDLKMQVRWIQIRKSNNELGCTFDIDNYKFNDRLERRVAFDPKLERQILVWAKKKIDLGNLVAKYKIKLP